MKFIFRLQKFNFMLMKFKFRLQKINLRPINTKSEESLKCLKIIILLDNFNISTFNDWHLIGNDWSIMKFCE